MDVKKIALLASLMNRLAAPEAQKNESIFRSAQEDAAVQSGFFQRGAGSVFSILTENLSPDGRKKAENDAGHQNKVYSVRKI